MFGVKLHRVTKLLRSTNADFSIGSFLDRKQLRKLMQHEDMTLVATNGSSVSQVDCRRSTSS
jgi:trehalose-6-phosphatase